ncbi:hypothetical protein CXG81DRAFT_26363 [Caulochytrium protostelioides]|uniref:Uncharacterized protein n=1 Tax=Caulochytrium protostelioides TaxID=1555241 RepID=A0A4P9X6Y6_9FUNG|nr:hypothetical protein CXG81DRAFT_26363 [Caulochytrium protostelioides]|eukprot:RKP00958.1 hypothetical protein CXG81DRAFT_26363 [Caulochytrium protostelioides]
MPSAVSRGPRRGSAAAATHGCERSASPAASPAPSPWPTTSLSMSPSLSSSPPSLSSLSSAVTLHTSGMRTVSLSALRTASQLAGTATAALSAAKGAAQHATAHGAEAAVVVVRDAAQHARDALCRLPPAYAGPLRDGMDGVAAFFAQYPALQLYASVFAVLGAVPVAVFLATVGLWGAGVLALFGGAGVVVHGALIGVASTVLVVALSLAGAGALVVASVWSGCRVAQQWIVRHRRPAPPTSRRDVILT